MNASNITAEKDPVYAGIFGCIMVIGLPLNAVSLWILLRRHTLRSPNAVFMVNLAISDLLLVISLPMRIYFLATGTWTLGVIACLISTMLFRNNTRSGAIFITFISMDRLLAVVYPLRSRHLRTSSNAWKGAALIWLVLLLVNIPETIGLSKHLQDHREPICFESHQYTSVIRSAVIYIQIVTLAAMLAVNIVCTIMVSWTLHTHLSDSAKVKNKVNVIVIFVMNLVIFCLCFLPVPLFVATKSKTNISPLVCITVLNCCLDPLMYYFSFDAFWKKKEDLTVGRNL